MSQKFSQYPYGERRLKPIYELLENGNNKRAIQEADKVLKKQPSLNCAKVLKALALLRLGKETDCTDLLDVVRKEKQLDESTLQAMTACYKDLNKFHLICEIFNAANAVDPKNEDILINLFNAYVRIGDYKKQQQTAIALYRINPKTQYHFWALMSILLQGVSIEDLLDYCFPALSEFRKFSSLVKERSSTNSLTLNLAERMINKMIQEDSIKSTNEAYLAIVVMEILQNYERALTVLQSMRDKIPPDGFAKKEIDLYIKQGNWKKAHILLKKLLKEEPDSWCLIQFYLESVFRIKDLDDGDSEDNVFLGANKFILELIDQFQDLKIRGPYLAQFELYKLMKLKNLDAKPVIGELEDLILNYAIKFNHLSCCSRDLAPYLPLLYRDEIKSFLSSLWKAVDMKNGEMPTSKNQINFHLTNLELTRASGLFDSMPVEDKSSLVSKLVNYFVHSQSLWGEVMPMESRASDRYIILAVHALHDLWLDTKDSNYIFEAICIADFGLSLSPANRQLKLLLLKLYHMLGATFPAHDYYKSLDIKHLQIDSLGYLHLWPTLACGDFTRASELLSLSSKFYSVNHKDGTDYLSLVYKNNCYIKIPEFISILESLNNSLHYKLVKVESAISQLVYSNGLNQVSCDKEAKWDDVDWSKLFDLRDMKVIWEVNGDHRAPTGEDMKQSMHQEIALLKLRLLLFKIITLIATMTTNIVSPTGEVSVIGKTDSGEETSGYESGTSDNSKTFQLYEINKSVSVLKDLNSELTEVHNKLKNQPPTSIPERTLTFPPASRLVTFLEYNYFLLIVHEVNFLHGLLQSGEESDPQEVQTALNCIYLYFNEFNNHISKHSNSIDPIDKKIFLTASTLYLEIFMFSSTVLRTMESIFKQKSSSRKAKKKKEPTATTAEETDNIWKEELIKDFKQCLQSSFDSINRLVACELLSVKTSKIGTIKSVSIAQEDYQQKLITLSSNVNDQILNSHTNCLNQIKHILGMKGKLYNS